MAKSDLDTIAAKYKERLAKKLGDDLKIETKLSEKVISQEYSQFKKELMPLKMSLYERVCNISERILKISPDKKKIPQIEKDIRTVHLKITPAGAYSFSLLGPMAVMFTGLMLSFLLPALVGKGPSTFFIMMSLIAGGAFIFPLQKMPSFIAKNWRLKASNQMVLCIFYVVTYMRHTSNLERAIQFAGDHLTGPLALDLKKVLWDVETGKHHSIKDSLNEYLETWKESNFEFVESFHLVESSLYEGSDARRVGMLDKALDIILSETYEKMMHYAQNLKSPITTLHMLGIILPILGLVILPLIVSFMAEVAWYHIAAIYNVGLPIAVFLMGKAILASRPTGYGDTDISEEHPELKKYKNIIFNIGKKEIIITPLIVSIALGGFLLFVAFSPLLLQTMGFPDIGFGDKDTTTACQYRYCLLDYREGPAGLVGPFSIIAAVLSLCFPLAVGLGVGFYFKLRSKNIIKIRNESKRLEQEFAGGLFQLGNKLGDGLPAEIAFAKVADTMHGTTTGKFFTQVSSNISQLGMSVEQALFDKKTGAITYFPSKMIESSMKVLTESAKKGPRIAGRAMINLSNYIKEMHRVDERLKDLLADIISSMKGQINFMTPAIAGIVVGITSMISNILGKLGPMLSAQGGGASGVGAAGAMPTDLFGMGIPTYFFQGMVGVYVVQITFILTIISNGIENGSDSLNEKYLLGKNLISSTLLYTTIALIIMILFNTVATYVLEGVVA
jgi:hypothetical protein